MSNLGVTGYVPTWEGPSVTFQPVLTRVRLTFSGGRGAWKHVSYMRGWHTVVSHAHSLREGAKCSHYEVYE